MKESVIVLFGATGDLATKKVFPALYKLHEKEELTKCRKIIAIGRKNKTSEEFVKDLKEKVVNYTEIEDEVYKAFSERIKYVEFDFNDKNKYRDLTSIISKYEGEKILYMATSPTYFKMITENLAKAKFFKYENVKLAIEKPFGNSYKSAKDINKTLKKYIKEKNIYRLDHYLGKSMLQNILALRFTNVVFENVWNKDYIESVLIDIPEEAGIEERGRYYDKAGAIRDMVQSHVLQIVALLTMERSKNINKSKMKILKSLKKMKKKEIRENMITGQYESYRSEKDVLDESIVETYVEMKINIKNKKWKNVPFYIRTGKKMDKKKFNISINFKESKGIRQFKEEELMPNKLIIEIYPKEGIKFNMNVKKPGVLNELDQADMEYCESCKYLGKSPEAYENIILNIINGDKTMFTSFEELKHSWKYIDRIIKYRNKDVGIYIDNSNGPIWKKS
ncbi:MAG: glucose-6-phosphate dehydrogenase [Clostridia bacterium]|jgi:glucose-6-phosphate 1-dehydrogenase|nr:glucose-6-phosphate dehydrogenase [Clostridia bacterium]